MHNLQHCSSNTRYQKQSDYCSRILHDMTNAAESDKGNTEMTQVSSILMRSGKQ